jgi:peptidoglycan hydrolase-like protein with peptidoglycan-binding domain
VAKVQVQLGSKGPAVLAVQRQLNILGYALAEDGIFGRHTKAAVRHLQNVAGIASDGIVGPNTHALLDAYVAQEWAVEEWLAEEWFAAEDAEGYTGEDASEAGDL